MRQGSRNGDPSARANTLSRCVNAPAEDSVDRWGSESGRWARRAVLKQPWIGVAHWNSMGGRRQSRCDAKGRGRDEIRDIRPNPQRLRHAFVRVIGVTIRGEPGAQMRNVAMRGFMGIVMSQSMSHVETSEGDGQCHRNARANQPGTCKTHCRIM